MVHPRTTATIALTLIVCLSSLHAQEMNSVAEPDARSAIAIVGGQLIDGNGGEPIDDSCVVVRGNRIVAVGPRNQVAVPIDATIVDASGKSVMPGMFDSHFHSRDSVQLPVDFELNNGITSFRDPGHPFKYYRTLLESDATIPRVFLCGGHLDAPPAVWPDQANVVTSQEEVVSAVDRNVRRGASAIKVYFRLPLEHVRFACEAAAKHKVPVTAHLELVDADDAIEAGVIGMEHITSFGTALASDDQTRQFKELVTADSDARKEWRYRMWAQIDLDGNPRVDELLDLIVRRGVYVSPTLAVFERRSGEKDATAVEAAGFANMLRFFGMCHQAGAKSVVGSHTWAPLAENGKAYLREAELMAEAGMSPMEVITAATKTGAEFFGVADRLGTIEPGKQADIILIDGDPSKNIRDLDNVDRVMLNGIWARS